MDPGVLEQIINVANIQVTMSSKNKVSVSVFGILKCEDGQTSRDVRKFVLKNKNGMSVEVTVVAFPPFVFAMTSRFVF